MNAYRYTVRPLSAWATPWHADTLWGSLCWAWREVHGEDQLTKLLEQYAAGSPAFVISNAFPSTLFPFPTSAKSNHVEGDKTKSLWCTVADFQVWSQGCSAPLAAPRELQNPFRTDGLLHAQRSRATDSTEGGELFELDQSTFRTEAFPQSRRPHIRNLHPRPEETVLPPLHACWQALTFQGFRRAGQYRPRRV